MNTINQLPGLFCLIAPFARVLILFILACSTVVSNAAEPLSELIGFSNVKRLGAFRLPGGDANYARGVIEINPANNSFYLAGHEHRTMLPNMKSRTLFPTVPI